MASNSLRESLTVEPDEEGIRRRQAEYILLAYLKEKEVAAKKEMELEVRRVVKKIAKEHGEPPIYFSTTTGQATHQSREFNEILERCIHRGWIESTIDGKYGITDEGINRVEELRSESEYNINRVVNFV